MATTRQSPSGGEMAKLSKETPSKPFGETVPVKSPILAGKLTSWEGVTFKFDPVEYEMDPLPVPGELSVMHENVSMYGPSLDLPSTTLDTSAKAAGLKHGLSSDSLIKAIKLMEDNMTKQMKVTFPDDPKPKAHDDYFYRMMVGISNFMNKTDSHPEQARVCFWFKSSKDMHRFIQGVKQELDPMYHGTGAISDDCKEIKFAGVTLQLGVKP